MAATRVHKVRATQLFDVTQTLELRSVNDPHHQWVELNVAVHRVIEHLQENTCGPEEHSLTTKWGLFGSLSAEDNLHISPMQPTTVPI